MRFWGQGSGLEGSRFFPPLVLQGYNFGGLLGQHVNQLLIQLALPVDMLDFAAQASKGLAGLR